MNATYQTDSARMVALVRRLKQCPVPTWSTIHHAEVSHLAAEPLTDKARARWTAEQWRERCAKQHKAAVRRLAAYVARIRIALQ